MYDIDTLLDRVKWNLRDAERDAKHRHGWSDNSYAYDLGEAILCYVPDIDEDEVDKEELGDHAIARLEGN